MAIAFPPFHSLEIHVSSRGKFSARSSRVKLIPTYKFYIVLSFRICWLHCEKKPDLYSYLRRLKRYKSLYGLSMPLLDLPNELLQNISENLKLERDINALTRTNRRLYSRLNPLSIPA